MNYQVVAIPAEIAQEARKNLKSPQYGHRAETSLAKGYGPCRVCLQTFVRDKENRILFTYNAFEGLSDLPLPSPIFIHEKECKRFEAAGFPAELRSLPLIFEGYAAQSQLIVREKVVAEKIEDLINRVFRQNAVDYVHIRNAEAGCFIARIERGLSK